MFPVDGVLLLTGLLCVESGRMARNISIARLTHKQGWNHNATFSIDLMDEI
jgi:hypothetical protein